MLQEGSLMHNFAVADHMVLYMYVMLHTFCMYIRVCAY